MPAMKIEKRNTCRLTPDIRHHTTFSAKFRSKSHPLQHGAPVSKHEVRAFQRPAPEIWTSLVTVLWLQTALEQLPASHPSRASLQILLEEEPLSPTSSSSASRCSSEAARQRPVQFDHLPAEVRNIIYCHPAAESSPISPVLRNSFPENARTEPHHITTGLPVHSQICPTLHAGLFTMLPKFYETNTFQLDLRQQEGTSNLHRWINDQKDETSAARTIKILHYSWYWNSSEDCWSYVTDATVLTLLATGRVKIQRTTGQLDPAACSCDMNDWFSAQCGDWTADKHWSMADFVQALRHEHGLLVQAVSKLVEIVQEHDESLHVWRKGPKACSLCAKQMIFFRTFDDVEWTSD